MSYTEDDFLNWIKEKYNKESCKSGIGDDCAVLPAVDRPCVQSIDTLSEGVHFLREDDPQKVGHKTVAVTLSDIAAMGARPAYIFLSLALPEDVNFTWIQKFYEGAGDLCRKFQVLIAGGDIVRSKSMVLTSAGVGYSEGEPFLRNTASEGDKVYVTGSFGFSYPSRHLRFMPRIEEALWLRNKTEVSAMTDASDGLYQSLKNISLNCGKGLEADIALIPVNDNDLSFDDSIRHALFDGEDFELVFSTQKMITEDQLLEFEELFALKIKMVGEISGSEKIIFKKNNEEYSLNGKPFQHFR